MRRTILALTVLMAPLGAFADTASATIKDIIDGHILPRFETLAAQSQLLAATAEQDCDPTSDALRTAYGAAFDAWVSASHLRIGPSEVNDRAFALAFWPDSRGTTPRTLGALLSEQDPIASSATDYAEVSIAARGFYALEFLLYDDALMAAGDATYHCQLIQTISADIAVTASDILAGWQDGYADTMLNPSEAGTYRSEEEVLQEMFKALTTGLEFTADTRLGRPLGTFDRPRPTRAEARRSGRSSRHVVLSLNALQDLALLLTGDDAALSETLTNRFDRALQQIESLGDPVFASVSEPKTRVKVEIIQTSIDAISADVSAQLGPKLGVTAGFNALDGD